MTLIRLITTDLDDTLLDAHSDVTARTVSAVRRAMDAGALFSLSSGRMPEAMLPLAEKLNVNAPMILYNGALIYDHRTGRTLFSNAIPAETALAVVRMLEQMGLYVQAYPGKGYYCERRCAFTEGYERSIRVPATELGVPVSQWMQGDMVKLLAIAPPEELADAARGVPDRQFHEIPPALLRNCGAGNRQGRRPSKAGRNDGRGRRRDHGLRRWTERRVHAGCGGRRRGHGERRGGLQTRRKAHRPAQHRGRRGAGDRGAAGRRADRRGCKWLRRAISSASWD